MCWRAHSANNCTAAHDFVCVCVYSAIKTTTFNLVHFARAARAPFILTIDVATDYSHTHTYIITITGKAKFEFIVCAELCPFVERANIGGLSCLPPEPRSRFLRIDTIMETI